jgi:hypothetical protein
MKNFLKNLLAYVWTPFNRDDLWNLSLNCFYCTYNPLKVKVGMVFCHVPGITVDHRIRTGTGLKVVGVLEKGRYRVKVPFVVASGSVGSVEPVCEFVVELLEGEREYCVGDWFVSYGQYEYQGIDSEGRKVARQVNRKGEHVFKEPFVDFGNGER